MIKRAGGWYSEIVVEGYIAESVVEKRKYAPMLGAQSKVRTVSLNGKKNQTEKMINCKNVQQMCCEHH